MLPDALRMVAKDECSQGGQVNRTGGSDLEIQFELAMWADSANLSMTKSLDARRLGTMSFTVKPFATKSFENKQTAF